MKELMTELVSITENAGDYVKPGFRKGRELNGGAV